MIAVGVFSTITFNEQIIAMLKGVLGPVLILLGAFIVWLESDEWKLKTQEKKESKQKQNLDVQKSLSETSKEDQGTKQPRQEAKTDTARYINALEGTVKEAQKNIREMNNPDLEKILELEKKGKDRKTIKEFIQRRMDN